jgi:RimJ/RimL family protein N-acetyltransferase
MVLEFNDYMIRDWLTEDAVSISRYADNRKIWINMRDVFPFPYKFSDAKAFLAKVMEAGPKTLFAIATSEEIIGGIGLDIQKDVHRYTAEMGYWLAEPFWGHGIMTNAVNRFTHFAFGTFELHRIFAVPYVYNKASIRVLEKAGFINEGRLRANAFKDGKIVDQFIYAKTMVDKSTRGN